MEQISKGCSLARVKVLFDVVLCSQYGTMRKVVLCFILWSRHVSSPISSPNILNYVCPAADAIKSCRWSRVGEAFDRSEPSYSWLAKEPVDELALALICTCSQKLTASWLFYHLKHSPAAWFATRSMS